MNPPPPDALCMRAQELRARLNNRHIDALGAAEVGRRIFTEAGDELRSRWLSLELNGYDVGIAPKPLHVILRAQAGDRLLRHILAYRSQSALAHTPGAEQEFRHFFIEPLWDLVLARRAVQRSPGTRLVALGFGRPASVATSHPREAIFTRDVFARILDGVGAALQLQLETFAQGPPCP